MLEQVIERDRIVLVAGLVLVIAMSWVWLLLGAGMDMNAFQMSELPDKPMKMAMQPAAWTPGYAALMFSMWWVMMIAMMLPSAAPMLLLFARINSKNKAKGAAAKTPVAPTGVFAAGYLIAWGGFSLVATGLQWGLERSGLLSNMLSTTNAWLGAGILIAAGLWQLTPIKAVCLRYCRSPLGYLMSQWRPGWGGAMRMGLRHGLFCLGCCWFLMALLFFGGVMNLYWIAGLAVFVLIEKLAPFGQKFGRASGVGLLLWGSWLAIQAL
jgi:predicted metal-binding membrane protein